MPPYVKLTMIDGVELRMPTPFVIEGRDSRSAGGSILYREGARWSVKEKPDEIAALLEVDTPCEAGPRVRAGVIRGADDEAISITRQTYNELTKISTAARRVVDERFRAGSEWEDLKETINALAELTGGGTIEDQQAAYGKRGMTYNQLRCGRYFELAGRRCTATRGIEDKDGKRIYVRPVFTVAEPWRAIDVDPEFLLHPFLWPLCRPLPDDEVPEPAPFACCSVCISRDECQRARDCAIPF